MGPSTVEITWLKKSGNPFVFQGETKTSDLKNHISAHFGISLDDFYLLQNGRLLNAASNISDCVPVQAVAKLIGGKGGFGSMLRAIGAQIEKTTNREACRDLSGRRLRDINEEKRLKAWISQQAERERQEADKKQRKIEKLRAQPKHEFSDKNYEEERAQILDKVHDAVEHGFQTLLPSTSAEASTSAGPSTSSKPGPSASSVKPVKKKPKKKGFMFEDEELSLSESELETDILNLEPSISSEPISKKRSLDVDSDSSPKKKKALEDEKLEDSNLQKEKDKLEDSQKKKGKTTRH